MRVINIIDSATRVNFGIWNAALFTAEYLKNRLHVTSEIWYPALDAAIPPGTYDTYPLTTFSIDTLNDIIKIKKLNPEKDIIVTHGNWRFPTVWGAHLKKLGFCWVVVPHGMLEPWSMQHKKWKKYVYFHLYEKRMLLQADVIRAVGRPERDNLKRLLPNQQITLIPNGVDMTSTIEKPTDRFSILFMSRLHHKKGVVLLVEAWLKSTLHHNSTFELIIAGPDEGEKQKMENILNKQSVHNITLAGAVYGPEKEALLQRCHYFALPSFSEGFPTAVLEGINYGLHPLISENCNFPELLEAGHATKLQPDVPQMIQVFNALPVIPHTALERKAVQARHFLEKGYTTTRIAEQQHQLYSQLLGVGVLTSLSI